MKFKIRLRDEITIEEVEGVPFRGGRFSFFMTKKEKGGWAVSELKTGMSFDVFGYSTKKEAIKGTKEAILRVGDKELLTVIESYIQRFNGVLNV